MLRQLPGKFIRRAKIQFARATTTGPGPLVGAARSWRAWAARPARLAANFTPCAAERARRNPDFGGASAEWAKCRTVVYAATGRCRAAARQKEEAREGECGREGRKGGREKKRTRGWCGHTGASTDTSTREMWCGSHDGGQRVPGRREDPPRHREHHPEESYHVSARVSLHLFPLSAVKRETRGARACFASPLSCWSLQRAKSVESAPTEGPKMRERTPSLLLHRFMPWRVRDGRSWYSQYCDFELWYNCRSLVTSRLTFRNLLHVESGFLFAILRCCCFPLPFPRPNACMHVDFIRDNERRRGAWETKRVKRSDICGIIDLKSPRTSHEKS